MSVAVCQELKTRDEILKAIKKAGACFVWVLTMPEDGLYMQISKTELSFRITRAEELYGDGQFLVRIEDNGYLFVN